MERVRNEESLFPAWVYEILRFTQNDSVAVCKWGAGGGVRYNVAERYVLTDAIFCLAAKRYAPNGVWKVQA